MKKFYALLLVGSMLGGCAQLQTAWNLVSGASVDATSIIVAANSFDALEATATTYLIACKAHPALAACVSATRVNVIAAVRAGRTARNGLEPYIQSGSAGPSALYNALTSAISTLQSAPITGASS